MLIAYVLASERDMVKFLIQACLTTVIVIVLGIFLSLLIPRVSNEERINLEKKTYSLEELDAATRKMQDKIDQYKKDHKSDSQYEIYQQSRQAGVWVTWLPWFIFAFLIKLYSYKRSLFLLSVPLISVLLKLILPIEFLLCSITFMLGIYIKKNYVQRTRKI